mmetsp:Transcript_47287/g.85239  ORF Transcript_47287/g.85239 Transcript_47287/m.85239 type:complete len:329 (+) Transcript_47287:807-1793(+)
MLPKFKSCSPKRGPTWYDLVVEGVAHLDACGIQQHQNALSQQPRVEVFADHELRSLRLTRQFPNVLVAEEDVAICFVVAEGVPRESHDLRHRLYRHHCVAVRLDFRIRNARLSCALGSNHGYLPHACPEVHQAQRRPIQFRELLTGLHDLFQSLFDGFSEGLCALLVPHTQQQPPGTANYSRSGLSLCLVRHAFEAHPGSTVGGADLDLIPFHYLHRGRQPLCGVPIVVAADRRRALGAKLVRRVVQLCVGRQLHFVPKGDAIQNSIFLGHEVEVALATQLHLLLREVKLKDLLDGPEAAPRLSQSARIKICRLIEGTPASLVPGTPV